MLTTDLGACEWFVWDLRRSNLIDRGQLDQVIGGVPVQESGGRASAVVRIPHRQELPHRLPGRAPAPGQDAGLRPRAVHAHGRAGVRQHGHGLQGPLEDRHELVRRQGAAPPQHVERPHRPPQGAAVRADPTPVRRAVHRRGHGGRHALPRLAPRRGHDARQGRRRARPSFRAGCRRSSTRCRPPRDSTPPTRRACSTASSSRRIS